MKGFKFIKPIICMELWEELSPYHLMVDTIKLKPRRYQIELIKSAYAGKNTLIVLPTGLGKTLIAIFAIARALHNGKKAIILAPTKPLSEQHYNSICALLKIDKAEISLLTGSVGATAREEIIKRSKVIIATPQTVSNDLKHSRLNLEEFGIVVFDECHRAVGRYAYTYIAQEAKLKGVQVLGMTASPGSDKKRINTLVEALGIEKIEARSQSDSDVEPYIPGIKTITLSVKVGQRIEAIGSKITPIIQEHMSNLYSKGISPFRSADNLPKGLLLGIGKRIDKLQADGYKFAALYDYVYVLNLTHAYDLLMTEGIEPFVAYMDSLNARVEKSRAVKNLVQNAAIAQATKSAKAALESGIEHPKMEKLVWLLKTSLNSKSAIVFAQYRYTIDSIVRLLNINNISAKAFVGKSQGFGINAQSEIIKDFRDNKFRVLVATSIGEEGLDIPSVDAVIFYEPVPNEIRSIQRRGRTGRANFGEVIILVAEGTRDEKYLMVARLKEKRMMEALLDKKKKLEKAALPDNLGVQKGQSVLK